MYICITHTDGTRNVVLNTKAIVINVSDVCYIAEVMQKPLRHGSFATPQRVQYRSVHTLKIPKITLPFDIYRKLFTWEGYNWHGSVSDTPTNYFAYTELSISIPIFHIVQTRGMFFGGVFANRSIVACGIWDIRGSTGNVVNQGNALIWESGDRHIVVM